MLPPDDHFAIRDLYARYNALVDTGDYTAWAACFTEDGVFSPAVESGGRSAIAALGKARYEARAGERWIQPQHWNNNLVLVGNGDRARATSYILRIVKMNDSGDSAIITQGMYQDELARIGGRWLFKVRRVTFGTLRPADVPAAD